MSTSQSSSTSTTLLRSWSTERRAGTNKSFDHFLFSADRRIKVKNHYFIWLRARIMSPYWNTSRITYLPRYLRYELVRSFSSLTVSIARFFKRFTSLPMKTKLKSTPMLRNSLHSSLSLTCRSLQHSAIISSISFAFTSSSMSVNTKLGITR